KDAIRTLLGLVVLFGLAWLGGHERVRALEERLGLTQLITSGFPFVILGLLAHTSAINILSEATLQRITPFLQFGLGWIGFHTGFQLEARRLMALPRGTATAIALLTVSPLLLIMATSGLVIWAIGQKHDWHLLLREGLMIGLAGSLSAPTLLRWLASSDSEERTAFVRSMSLLDDVFVILALAVISAWLRPSASTGWILPGVGWFFVIFGMAAVFGALADFTIALAETRAERSALVLAFVALSSGMAALFQIPPLVVSFLAGMVFRNIPSPTAKNDIEETFARLERPIYLVFLIIVGALWHPGEALGWVLVIVLFVARTIGRKVGAIAFRRALPKEASPLHELSDFDLVLPPLGPLALAFMITAQVVYESPAIRAMVTGVLGTSILLEVFAQVFGRERPLPQKRDTLHSRSQR
ncbi:MAG: cation:proton antiporter, partial [Sandaracinaceae bacterium]|nr:cation:proton antiporter [Sandaracinaceae bacterium]